MAQLVPCSSTFPQPLMLQQPLNSGAAINHQATTTTTTLADFNNTHQIHQQQNSTSFLEVPYATAGGQTVPSSPTFSTWNYSPPSYWSDNNYNRSPPLVIKSEPVGGCHQVDETVADSSLEELLDDYTFDYYSSDIQESLETASSAISHQQHISKPIIIKQEEASSSSSSQGHALLRQCLRPAADDYQQRCHLQFLNQIGSAIAALPQQQQQQQEMLSIKTEKSSSASGGGYWPNGNPNTAQGLASVLSLVMEQVNEEVRSTCEILGVSPSKFLLFFIFRSILLLSAFTLILLLVNEFFIILFFFDQIFANALESFWRLMAGQGPVYPAAKKLNRLAFRAGTPFFILSSFSSSLLFRTKQKGAQREGQSDA